MWKWLRIREGAPRYSPPRTGQTLYAIGDIHGRLDCLRRVFAAIDADKRQHSVGDRAVEIYVGDYVDRGPEARGVIDALIARSEVAETVFLRGNHEIVMTSFLRGDLEFEAWRRLGGAETILSYGFDAQRLREKWKVSAVDLARLMPVPHFRFLDRLRPYFLAEPYCFVHAGLRPGVALEHQKIEDLAWIREDFLDHSGSFGPLVIHGHTPVTEIDFRRNRINIDTGAYLTNRLSVIRVDDEGVAPLAVGRT